MNLLTLEYDESKKSYTFSFSKNAPPNCEAIEYNSFSVLDLKGPFILFIGSIWSGNLDVRIASSLGDIACYYPRIKFYFRVILDDAEIDTAVPKTVEFTHLPIVLFVEDFVINTLSTGPVNRDILESKIAQALKEK